MDACSARCLVGARSCQAPHNAVIVFGPCPSGGGKRISRSAAVGLRLHPGAHREHTPVVVGLLTQIEL